MALNLDQATAVNLLVLYLAGESDDEPEKVVNLMQELVVGAEQRRPEGVDLDWFQEWAPEIIAALRRARTK